MTENRKSFWHFITNVCAIIGGVFTVSFPLFLQICFHNLMNSTFECSSLWAVVSGCWDIGFSSAQHNETDEKG